MRPVLRSNIIIPHTTKTEQRRECKKLPAFFMPKPKKGAFIMAVFRIEKIQNYTVMTNPYAYGV